MSVLKRLSGIVQAKANKALDRVEDPRETLDLSYEKQLEQLQQVKKGVADVATARKRIEIQAQQLQQSASKLQDQARQALGQNREDLAREALSRRAAIGTQLDQLRAQHEQLAAQQEKLVATTQALQTRIDAFRTQKETLKASYTAAQAQTKIGEAISGISESMGDTGLAMERAQDKIAQMQARAGAVDELLASGALTDLTGSTDSLQSELDRTAQGSQVELELAQLKGQLAAGGPSGELERAAPAAPAATAAPQATEAATEPEATTAPEAGQAPTEATAAEAGEDTDEPVDGEPVPPSSGEQDPFSLDGGAS